MSLKRPLKSKAEPPGQMVCVVEVGTGAWGVPAVWNVLHALPARCSLPPTGEGQVPGQPSACPLQRPCTRGRVQTPHLMAAQEPSQPKPPPLWLLPAASSQLGSDDTSSRKPSCPARLSRFLCLGWHCPESPGRLPGSSHQVSHLLSILWVTLGAPGAS